MSLKEKQEGHVKGFGWRKWKGETMPLYNNLKYKKWRQRGKCSFIFLRFLITVTRTQDVSSFYYWFIREIIEQRAQWKDVLTEVCNSIANGKRQVNPWFWLTSLASLPTTFEGTEGFNFEMKTKQFSLSATHSSTNILEGEHIHWCLMARNNRCCFKNLMPGNSEGKI